MEKPTITAYLKTYCGWSAGVRAILQKHKLPYTEKDIIQSKRAASRSRPAWRSTARCSPT